MLPIACAQMACACYDPPANRVKADELIREASRQGARLVLLPEFLTTNCTYDDRLHSFAEPVGGATTFWMLRRSRQMGLWIGGGIIEEADKRVYDTFVLAGPAGEVHSYRKQYPVGFENLFFHRGSDLGIFNTSLGRIGVMICWDMVQPRLSREMAGRIDLLLISSAWPAVGSGNIPLLGIRSWLDRQPLQRPRQLARELNTAVVYCNMTGSFATQVPGLGWLGITFRSDYAGSSSITEQGGNKMTVVGREERILVADVGLGLKRLAA